MSDEKHFKLVVPMTPEDFETDDQMDGPRTVFVALMCAGLTILIVLAFMWAMTQPVIAI